MRKKILIVGDSHNVFFKRSARTRFHLPAYLDELKYEVLVKHGATIRGFGNRKSTLQLSEEIDHNIRSTCPTHLVLGLGQVDIELGIYYKSFVKNESVENFISETLDVYFKYLKSLNMSFPDIHLIIKGINPTVLQFEKFAVSYISRIITENIKDKAVIERYQSILEENLPFFHERHALSLRFNTLLQQRALDKGITYFDLWGEFTDRETGVIAERFIPCGFDHHVSDTVETRRIYQQGLFNCLNKI